ncbi:hypothetical protein INH39_25730 [Massilia violaceinigra]|uniref:Heavy metal-binding domain-containing protein n=1 Tax=Massilia violaceinigra TaxID=2045208 RepID=A0ABY4A2B1_9BURK|nr:hypothetical protein [Massilia violaceinigra]UOD28813.1 hypothetical protein INH39_25730 [Massilia violaceinigra]
MLLLTTDAHPEGLQPLETFSMILVNKTVEISSKGLRGLFGAQKNEYQEAIDSLTHIAPDNANAIVGIKISTAAQNFNNGTFLYLTIVGTPVRY